MTKIIKKIRNKRLKGNVSLLVILILLASSVISLLSINQIQHLISYGNMTFNYFRSFYIAKAGTELGLTEVYHREAGFNQTINSGDSIVLENLVGVYTGFNPYFNMTITGEFKHLTDDIRYTNECSGNEIILGTGEGIMLSLFRDDGDEYNDINEILSDESHIEKNIDFSNIELENLAWSGSEAKPLTFGLFDYNTGMENIYVETFNYSPTTFLDFLNNIGNLNSNDKRYLTIKNPGDSDGIVSFCVYNNDNLIPYSDYLITVQANYGDMEVGLQSVVKNGIPYWALDVLGQDS